AWLAWASVLCAQDGAPNAAPVAVAASSDNLELKAYIATLPSAPTPKVEAAASTIIRPQTQAPVSVEQGHRFYLLDRKSLIYAAVLGGAEIFDGATTRYFIHHCSYCFENDPMSRLLLGTHPSWSKMIPMGIVEGVV